MKWALAGYGDLSQRRLATALQTSRSELISVWGRRIERARTFALRHNIAVAARTLDELFEGVDAVYVATPVATHVEIARAALIAGKHVLIEKPVSPNLRPGDELISIARSRGLCAGVAYYRRMAPALRRVREILGEELGEPRHVDVAHTTRFAPDASDPKAWRLDASMAGAGCLADSGSHRIDILVWLFGLPQAVGASCADLTRGGVERRASLRLKWAGELTANCFFDWRAGDVDRISFLGDSVRIEIAPLDEGKLRIISQNDVRELRLPPPPNPHLALVQNFEDAVAHKRDPVCPLQSGLLTDRIIEAALRSNARNGSEEAIESTDAG
jgi:predicted dehydrogenase